MGDYHGCATVNLTQRFEETSRHARSGEHQIAAVDGWIFRHDVVFRVRRFLFDHDNESIA